MNNRIFIAPVAQAKIDNWVKICPKEISGLGTVEVLPDGTLMIDQVYLLKQECTASDTELDSFAITELMGSLPQDKREKLRFWWHSHVNMDVFWSGTDLSAIQTLRSTVKDFLISIVYNKRGQYKARLDVMAPFCNTHFDNQPLYKDASPDYLYMMKAQEIAEDTTLTEYQRVMKGWQELSSFDTMKKLREDMMEHCKAEYDEKVTLRSYATVFGKGYGGYAAGASSRWTKKTTKPKTKKLIGLGDDDIDDVLDDMERNNNYAALSAYFSTHDDTESWEWNPKDTYDK